MVEIGEDSARGGFALGFQPLGSRAVPVPLTDEQKHIGVPLCGVLTAFSE